MVSTGECVWKRDRYKQATDKHCKMESNCQDDTGRLNILHPGILCTGRLISLDSRLICLIRLFCVGGILSDRPRDKSRWMQLGHPYCHHAKYYISPPFKAKCSLDSALILFTFQLLGKHSRRKRSLLGRPQSESPESKGQQWENSLLPVEAFVVSRAHHSLRPVLSKYAPHLDGVNWWYYHLMNK